MSFGTRWLKSREWLWLLGIWSRNLMTFFSNQCIDIAGEVRISNQGRYCSKQMSDWCLKSKVALNYWMKKLWSIHLLSMTIFVDYYNKRISSYSFLQFFSMDEYFGLDNFWNRLSPDWYLIWANILQLHYVNKFGQVLEWDIHGQESKKGIDLFWIHLNNQNRCLLMTKISCQPKGIFSSV